MQWLISGCSTGLGLSLARAVLAHPGERVIATSRDPASSREVIDQITLNENAVWERLDVSSPDLEDQLSKIIAKHGSIDVLINNAGYAGGGVFEVTPVETLRQQFETNFFGAVRLMQEVVPAMRKGGRGGVIVNVTSTVFWQAPPVTSAYSASKWALEGLSEAIALEIAAFNIRVLIAEPGGMRTSFFEPSKISKSTVPFPDTYKGTIAEYVLKALESMHGEQNLDPERSAQAIVQEVLEPTLVNNAATGESHTILRLQLGREAVDTMEKKIMAFQSEANLIRAKALACDFGASED
jgi:NAD(P)-dependent dehydrogenase (short-subunit alcohol dehydrogenase family)